MQWQRGEESLGVETQTHPITHTPRPPPALIGACLGDPRVAKDGPVFFHFVTEGLRDAKVDDVLDVFDGEGGLGDVGSQDDLGTGWGELEDFFLLFRGDEGVKGDDVKPVAHIGRKQVTEERVQVLNVGHTSNKHKSDLPCFHYVRQNFHTHSHHLIVQRGLGAARGAPSTHTVYVRRHRQIRTKERAKNAQLLQVDFLDLCVCGCGWVYVCGCVCVCFGEIEEEEGF